MSFLKLTASDKAVFWFFIMVVSVIGTWASIFGFGFGIHQPGYRIFTVVFTLTSFVLFFQSSAKTVFYIKKQEQERELKKLGSVEKSEIKSS